MDSLRPQDLRVGGDLDPEDWDSFEETAHKLLADAIATLKNASEGPVWQAPSNTLKQALATPAPTTGLGTDTIAEDLSALIPFRVGNTHPRFFGWVHGSGTPGNLLADIIAGAMNANCGGREHAAIYVERQTVGWMRDLFNFPADASGLIVSGTSMATLIAAKVARDVALGEQGRSAGVSGTKLVGYVSTETHSCVARAFDMLGLGTDALRQVAVNDDFEMDISDLARQVEEDRSAGLTPFFVCGTVGTVNTGAIDDLAALAEFAEAQGLWFHVDGAFGASAILCEKVKPRLIGIETADSLAFDFHKWMHVNYDAGCVLIRSGDAHRKSFQRRPDYLAASPGGLAAGEFWPVDYGPELSRGFRALKVWAHIREHGLEKIGQSINKNCRQAAYLADRIDAHPSLERLAPVTLNICCFRANSGNSTVADLDGLNAKIVEDLQVSGIAAPSTTRIDGKLAIRVNLTNHRTRFSDIDILISAIEDLLAHQAQNHAQ